MFCRSAGALTDAFHGPASTLTDAFHSPASTLTDALHGPASTLTDAFHSAASPLTDALHSAASPLTDPFDCATGALADALQGPAGSAADLTDRLAHSAGEPLQDLRVLVEGRHHPVQDCGDVVKADLQQRRRLHALDRNRDPSERHVRAHVQLEQVENLGLEGNPGLQILYLQRDLIDLDHRDIEQYVRLLIRRPVRTDAV